MKHFAKFRAPMLAALGSALALGLMASPAQAQRDPAYAAARSAGTIGEMMDGYLGIVSAATPALRALVDDLNIRRRAVYSERARSEGATVQEYAFTSGCVAILRTVAGEKYQAPDGSWQTRTASDPIRDPRCP